MVDEPAARAIALQLVQQWLEGADAATPGNWRPESTIGAVTPIYNDGIEGISYWECKVQTGTQDAGYILVTANKSDIPIPEFTTTGPTMTEGVAIQIPGHAFKLLRYGYVGIQAIADNPESNDTSRSLDADQVLYSDGISGFETSIPAWRLRTQKEGMVPYYSRTMMKQAATASRQIQSRGISISPPTIVTNSSGTFQSQIMTYTLNNTYADGNNTVSWHQHKEPGSNLTQPAGYAPIEPNTMYPLGCAPTAFGISLAYWQTFRGKSNLFPGVALQTHFLHDDSDLPSIYLPIQNIASCMGTYWGYFFGSPGEATPDWTIANGIKYAIKCDYPGSTSSYIQSGTDQWNLFTLIATAISNDRPPVVGIYVNTDTYDGAMGIADNHVVVVEAARYSQFNQSFAGLFWWGWARGSVSYKLIMGWGSRTLNDHRWIFTLDIDPAYTPTGPQTSMFNFYDIKIQ